MKKRYFYLLLILLYFPNAKAQNWLKDMYDPHVNFYNVQQEFNDWWAINKNEILRDSAKGEGEHGEAWRIYKRWEHDVAPMMMARQGNRLGAFNQAEANYYAGRRAQSNLRSGASWTYIGTQHSFDDGGGDSSTGRVNCVRFDPSNPNTIYCGAPSGGLWKSVNFGQSWQLLNTDNLGQIGISDIAINPNNSNTIYIATGDIANSATYSIGVLKSTDGGNTWDTTGLTWTVSQGLLIARLLMNPNDSNTLLAATNAGVYKTSDGGNTWSADTSIYGLTGMEYNPSNPNTIYTWGTQLYKSMDGAATWQHLTGGLPNARLSGGFAVGLTPADTNCVYVLVTDTATGASYVPFNGIYRSLNGGTSFTLRSSNPDPTGTGTQGLYDLNVAVSPTNREQLVMAAVENAFSSDGGLTWRAPAFNSHVDHHDLRFYPGSSDTVFSADDGGLFISADRGNTWAGLNDGMHIGELYNISSSNQTKYLFLTGRQDEGTLLEDTSFQKLADFGDGLQCLVDPTNQNNMFASSEYGLIVYSKDGGYVGNILTYNSGTGVNGPGAWNTPYALDPLNNHTIFVAKDYIYESTDSGNTWLTLNSPNLSSGSSFDQVYITLAIAPSNDQYIYAGTYYHLYGSADGGNTFTDITSGLHTPFFSLAVSPGNPLEIWVGTEGGHIYKSINGGSHWTDFSTGLPVNTPFYPQTIAPVRNSPDALYTGLYYAGGVYYRDSTMSQWMPYSNGLPNVSVNQLEIDYYAGKIRAATYGRDVWEIDPYLPLATEPAAEANYTLVSTGHCSDTIQFTDISAYYPTSRKWYFPGGQPDSSISQDPRVAYPDNGNYIATLIATNSVGSDTAQYYISSTICTGIDEVSEDNSIQIIPNPNNGNFVISFNDEARGNVSFDIFNNVGQNVYQYTVVKNSDEMSNEFSLSELSAGVYFVHIKSDDINSVKKLVIGN